MSLKEVEPFLQNLPRIFYFSLITRLLADGQNANECFIIITQIFCLSHRLHRALVKKKNQYLNNLLYPSHFPLFSSSNSRSRVSGSTYCCFSAILISEGKENKQRLQTLQTDSAWSKKRNCINLHDVSYVTT